MEKEEQKKLSKGGNLQTFDIGEIIVTIVIINTLLSIHRFQYFLNAAS